METFGWVLLVVFIIGMAIMFKKKKGTKDGGNQLPPYTGPSPGFMGPDGNFRVESLSYTNPTVDGKIFWGGNFVGPYTSNPTTIGGVTYQADTAVHPKQATNGKFWYAVKTL